MTVDFEMYAGDTKILKIECLNEDTGGIIDLTNAQDMNFVITEFGAGTSNVLISKTISSIGIEDTNTAVITIEGNDTINLNGKFKYYFQVKDYGGDKFTKSGLCLININGIA